MFDSWKDEDTSESEVANVDVDEIEYNELSHLYDIEESMSIMKEIGDIDSWIWRHLRLDAQLQNNIYIYISGLDVYSFSVTHWRSTTCVW